MIQPSIHKLIETENFTHYYQGLYHLDAWTKIGNETLFRSEIGNPSVVFQEAKKVNRLYELEVKSIYKAVKNYHSLEKTPKGLLFINICPSTIENIHFPKFIKHLSIQIPIMRHSIVFEILETEQVENFSLFKERITYLKNLGYLIAIDDVGKGWSSLNMIIELKPDYIKLDRFFSVHLSCSPLKQEMIRSLLYYGNSSNVKVVLEGMEKEQDFAVAKSLGVKIFQGFLFEKPHPLEKNDILPLEHRPMGN